MNYVSLLPLEMQVKIFAKLTVQEKGRCAVVCRAWRDTVYLPDIWRDVTYTSTNHAMPSEHPALLESLAARDIRRAKLIYPNEIDTNFVLELYLSLPNFDYLVCSGCLGADERNKLAARISEISSERNKVVHFKLGEFPVYDVADAVKEGFSGKYAFRQYLIVDINPKFTNTRQLLPCSRVYGRHRCEFTIEEGQKEGTTTYQIYSIVGGQYVPCLKAAIITL